MGEIIRDWLQTRLGIIIDLSPEIFGHFARDGTLLAKVLHSYDVINDSQLNTLLNTQDPALSRVNLKHLRTWLKFVGVDCDNDCIEDISNGKGTMALRLFYKVFLCLENKDRLHFITLQKEREKYIPSSSKFDVTTISEEPRIKESKGQFSYAALLRRSASLVDWRRKKYGTLTDGGEKEGKLSSSPKEMADEIVEKTSGGVKKSVGKMKKMESPVKRAELRELDEFARKHRAKRSEGLSDPCEEVVASGPPEGKTPRIDEDAARAYTESLRNKRRREALSKGFKSRMQKNLLNDLWNKVLDDQEKEFDELIAKKVLHQSLYEKQLIRKLCDIRNEKTRMAANRGIVEKLFQETREREMRLDEERAREVMVRENEELEAERRRINELERRIEERAEQRKNEKLGRFAAKILYDLVDMAIKVSRYKNQSNENEAPTSLWNRWKALFVKNQPIIGADEEIIIATEDIEEEKKGQEEEEDTRRDVETEDDERTRVLNDEDFDNYERTGAPWKDYLPKIDDEVRQYLTNGPLVLGYVVHKVLNYLDADHPEESAEASLPMMRTRAVVLGLPDSLLYEPIEVLLKNSRVHLTRIEQAINHCLERYKEEMRDFEYIDLEIKSATTEARDSSTMRSELEATGKKLPRGKKSPGRTKTGASFEKIETAKKGVDKVTQTPRVIPHEDRDPLLSNAAYFGKWIHEFFTLGQALSDELISRTIVEYLRSLENVRGFVLVDYPNTHRQMSLLERALGGGELSGKGDERRDDEDDENIDETDRCLNPRIIFEDETSDREDSWTESRLFPNPTKRLESTPSSRLTAFVRIKEKSTDKNVDDDIWEILSEDASPVDAFYADREIASCLYYKIFDLSTLKKLVRLLIADENQLISRVSSGELFGDYLGYFEGRREDDYSARKEPTVKKLLLPSRTSEFSYGDESRSTRSIVSTKFIDEFSSKSTKRLSSPGDVEWPWANFPQPLGILQDLARHWRRLETRYVENLKEIFRLKRMNESNVAPYVELITRHASEFIDRPDKKQDCLHEFHRSFNQVHQDIRQDSEIKRELYCGIDDFETRMWEICDSRRREAEDEKNRIIDEDWTSMEIINTANVYIDILQNEMDRCNDTLQFINDYYASMLERPLREIRSIVTLRRIETSSGSLEHVPSRDSSKSTRDKEEKEARARTSLAKQSPRTPSPPPENLAKLETAKLLSDVDDKNAPSVQQSVCYRAVEANVKYIDGVVESLASRIFDSLKREETNALKSSSESRDNKKSTSRKTSLSAQFEGDDERVKNLIVEWRYASMFEINRIRVRIKILDAAARRDMNNLLANSRRLFSDIQRNLLARYDREVKSVNEMARVFRFAVEEATPIMEEMLLDGDRFIVRSNVLMFPEKPRVDSRARENVASGSFTASQLSRLVDIFLRSAPRGILSERSFVYMIQDLIVCDEEKGENSILPSSWYELRGCDVPRLVDELFGDAEFVDWREFIIHAMNLDAPSIDDVLNDLQAFREFDEKRDEIVSRRDFHSVKLWFAGETRSNENFASSAEERDEGRSTKINDNSNLEADEIEGRKNILRRMFSYDDERVNYVALLMAFCRDERPEVGLAKALSLAIGEKICVDWQIGEEYARSFFETRLEPAANGKDTRREAAEISKALVHWLLKGFFRSTEFLEESDDYYEMEDQTWNSDVSWSSVGSDLGRRNKGLSLRTSPSGKNESSRRSRSEERPTVHWLNFNVAQTLLAAVLPYHAAQPDVFESGKSLRENLDLVRLELGTQGINDESSGLMILAHRFLHHDFVEKLLAGSGKFTTKSLPIIIDKFIRAND